MIDTVSVVKERRTEVRKKVKIGFLIKIGRMFNGRGIVKDLTHDSMRLECPLLFKPRTTIQSREYIGQSIRLMFPSDGITINGVIAWVDLVKGEGAIRISNTSDDNRWQKIYEKT